MLESIALWGLYLLPWLWFGFYTLADFLPTEAVKINMVLEYK